MNPNVRLGIIVVVFVIVGAVIWTVLGGSDGFEDQPLATTTEEADQSTPSSAPEPTRQAATTSFDEATPAEQDTSGLKSGTNQRERSQSRPTGIYTIIGTVVDPDNNPVTDVEVELTHVDFRDPDPLSDKHFRLATTTDGDGKFAFGKLRSGGYTVSARTEGYAAYHWGNVSDWRPQESVELRLELAYGIKGRVVNSDGDPIADALVGPKRVHTDDDENEEGRSAEGQEFFITKTLTDAEGAFELFGLEEGAWDLLAFSKEYATAEAVGIPTGSENIEIVMLTGGSLTGTVVSEDTRDPVAEVEVAVGFKDSRWDRHAAVSDAEGRFVFDDLRAGEYHVGIIDDLRVVAHRIEPIEIVEEDEYAGLQIRVHDGGTVEGRIFEKDTNKGIRGAVIHANNADYYGQDQGPPVQSRESEPTEADGSFRISGLSDARYVLYPQEVGEYTSSAQGGRVTVTANFGKTLSGVQISLEKGLSLYGIVRDKDGKPVEGASISGRSSDYQSRGNAVSGPGGRFEVSGFSLVDAFLWAEYDNVVSNVAGPIKLHEYTGEDIELTLKDERNCIIAGDVVDTQGRPLDDVNLWINSETHRHMNMPSAQTGEDGTYEVKNLPPGEYRVRCSKPGGYQQGGEYRELITLKSGERRDGVQLVVEGLDGYSISGRVTNTDGEPLQHANINAWNAERGGQSYYTNSDEDGNFELTGLEQARYRLNFYRGGYSRIDFDDVEAGTRNFDVQMQRAAQLSGYVTDAETGEPVTEFELMTTAGTTTTMQGWFYQQMLRTYDPDGYFETTTDSDSSATIIVRGDGYAPAFHPIPRIVPNESIENIQIALEPGTAVSGTVMDDEGTPVSRAMVYIGGVPDEYQRTSAAAATTDEAGKFFLEGLPRTERVISAWHPAYAPGTGRVPYTRSGTAEADIILTRGGTIQGRITVGGRQPQQRVYLNYRHEAMDGADYHEVNSDGTFEIEGLPAVTVTVDSYLQVEENRSRNLERTAVVAPGEVTVVDFDYPELNASMEGRVMIGDRPAESGSVRATVPTTYGEESFRGEIQSDGSYRVEEMAAGTAEIYVTGSNRDSRGTTTATVTVTANSTLTQDFDLQEYIRITGRVSGGSGVNRGVSAYRGHITVPTPFTAEILQELDRSRADRFTSNNTVGEFEYEIDLPGPGEYTLSAYSLDGTDAASLAAIRFATVFVTVEEGDRLEMDLQIP